MNGVGVWNSSFLGFSVSVCVYMCVKRMCVLSGERKVLCGIWFNFCDCSVTKIRYDNCQIDQNTSMTLQHYWKF